jgi:catecholate siderophore receptor
MESKGSVRGSFGVRSLSRGAARATALIGATLLAAGAASAQRQAAESEDEKNEDVVEVIGERLEEGLGTRYTAPLLETPQTVTLVPREIMDQQNLLTMRDVLSTLPGITFTAGEGGGGYGDGVNLRGFSATNDISTDGVRDSAQYSRTDPFNLEQLELVSGANSVYTGAGSVGGSINLVTKSPRGMPGTTVSVAGGTDAYARATVDSEVSLTDIVDLRLNLMAHQNDVPGRDVETYERWGVAPSIAIGRGTDTSLTLAYVHQEDDNIPQYGAPYALGAFNDGPLPGVPSSAYYGSSNVDTQEIGLDALTGTIEHEFSDSLRVRNLTRWQQVDVFTITSPPQGTWCVAPGINPWTGAACSNPGVFLPQALTPQPPTTTGPRGTTRDTTNDILINQTDFTAEFATGPLQHTLVTGFSISEENYHRDNGNSLRGPLGEIPVLPPMDIADPNHVYTGPVNFIVTGRADGDVSNQAVYAFDRIEFAEGRFEINGGVRYERNEGESTTATVALPPAMTVTQDPIARNEDDLFSYRIGFVWNPTETSSLYIAHGNSQTPSQSSVNGSCDLVTNCNVDPEEAESIEVGAKWDALGERLSLTTAVFRNERTNFRVASGDPTVPEQQLDGSSRVDGVALGAAGQITEKWSVFANYTFLDSEIVQNISDIAIGGGQIDFRAGDPLPNTPEHSGSFWTTYQLTNALLLGYGATYQGEYTFNRANTAAALYYTLSYWVHRAMAAYEVNDNLAIQLNVNNLTDEEYFTRVRNNPTNGWATPGEARSAVVSLTYRR